MADTQVWHTTGFSVTIFGVLVQAPLWAAYRFSAKSIDTVGMQICDISSTLTFFVVVGCLFWLKTPRRNDTKVPKYFSFTLNSKYRCGVWTSHDDQRMTFIVIFFGTWRDYIHWGSDVKNLDDLRIVWVLLATPLLFGNGQIQVPWNICSVQLKCWKFFIASLRHWMWWRIRSGMSHLLIVLGPQPIAAWVHWHGRSWMYSVCPIFHPSQAYHKPFVVVVQYVLFKFTGCAKTLENEFALSIVFLRYWILFLFWKLLTESTVDSRV